MIKRHPQTGMWVLEIEHFWLKVMDEEKSASGETLFPEEFVTLNLGRNHSRNKIRMPKFHSHCSNFTYVS